MSHEINGINLVHYPYCQGRIPPNYPFGVCSDMCLYCVLAAALARWLAMLTAVLRWGIRAMSALTALEKSIAFGEEVDDILLAMEQAAAAMADAVARLERAEMEAAAARERLMTA